MSEREYGWPEGYGWYEYIEGQVELAKANRVRDIIVNEIAVVKDIDELRRAIDAFKSLCKEQRIQMTGNGSPALARLETYLLSARG
jgi:predicted signal transduction protein with EAL and GGDEF domain